MRVAALGRTGMLYDSIRLLAARGHRIPLIVTCKASPESDVSESDFSQLARELHAEFLLTQDLSTPTSLAVLRGAQADVAVSVNWINLVGAAACSAFRFGILNAHAGELPRYRGNAPIAWAILQGESRVGLTIHQMRPEELDAGPILKTDYFPLDDGIYIGEVFSWLRSRIPGMFGETIEGLADRSIQPKPQPAEPVLALRCYPRRPEDGLLRWSESAVALGRLVRASAEPFSGAFTRFRGDV